MVVRRQVEKKNTSGCRPSFKNVACLSSLMLMKISKKKGTKNKTTLTTAKKKEKEKLKTQHTFQEIIIYYYPFRT